MLLLACVGVFWGCGKGSFSDTGDGGMRTIPPTMPPPGSMGPNQCFLGEFLCDGRCKPSSLKCDRRRDCADVDDEANCSSIPSEWKCPPSAYDQRDGCDCGCGAPDPDCETQSDRVKPHCEDGERCTAENPMCTAEPSDPPPGMGMPDPEPMTPSGWTCRASWYDANDGCDCGCGTRDPDCDDAMQRVVVQCPTGETCDRTNLACSAPAATGSGSEPPSRWTCPRSYYDSNDGCDCGCGARDPDCDEAGATLKRHCTGSETCDATNITCRAPTGTMTPMPPSGWDTSKCPATTYGTRDGCDCGCGARDPDCDIAGQSVSTHCSTGQTCDRTRHQCSSTSTGTTRLPYGWNTSRCPASYYNSGDGCDCGCGAKDLDCDRAGQRLHQHCTGGGQCTARAHACTTPSRPTPPSSWTCSASWYGRGNGCDCGCGAMDPDCSNSSQRLNQRCNNNGTCTRTRHTCMAAAATPPSSWRCVNGWYGSRDGCDCGCGAPDPDCSIAGQRLYNRCTNGQTCTATNQTCTGSTTTTPTVTVPSGWTCENRWYGQRDGCECGCGVRDPDCDVAGQTLFQRCSNGQMCTASNHQCTGGTTSNPTPPSSWNNCPDSYYGRGDGCDCGCGAPDPDCNNSSQTLHRHCPTGQTCSRTAHACTADSTSSGPPPGWTCSRGYYGTNDGCDCGCGVLDPDCNNASATVHEQCTGDNQTCGRTDTSCRTDTTSDRPSSWTCPTSYYAGGDGCDCGCGAPDPDCTNPSAALWEHCDEGDSCSATDHRCSSTNGHGGAWTCSEAWYDSDDGCDCGCGALDPDCNDSSQAVMTQNCPSGQTCNRNQTVCVPEANAPPSGWTCNASWWNDGSRCDCGCGVVDEDCSNPSNSLRQSCSSGQSCSRTDTSCSSGPPSSWRCHENWWDASDGCDCGCGAVDPDCSDLTQNVIEQCQGTGSCGRGDAECTDVA